jgi:DNA-binding transcriptional regulator YhcF (GntR family)
MYRMEGVRIVCVEPGHVVRDRKGNELTVTRDFAVRLDSTIYVVAEAYEALKRDVRVKFEKSTPLLDR